MLKSYPRPTKANQHSEDRPTQPARVHLDLYTRQQGLHRTAHGARCAERVEDWPYPPNADLIVLRDRDGNEFCVIDHEALIAST
jgi:Glyoxalase-like domain